MKADKPIDEQVFFTYQSRARAFLKDARDPFLRFLEELLYEKYIGNSCVKGEPLCKKAWVESEKCFRSSKVVQEHFYDKDNHPGEGTRMVVEISIYPRRGA